MNTRNARTRTASFGAPAVVIGTLAATLTAAPAEATERVPAETGPIFAHSPRPLVAQASTPRPLAAHPTTHTVQPGDTVSGIASKHGLRTADVLAWNGLGWRSVIVPGQKLRLTPASAPVAAKPAAAPAQTATKTHTVVRGDTVYAIAKKYRTTAAAIISANGLGRSAVIHPGQKLKVGTAAIAPRPAAAKTAAPAQTAKPTSHTVVAGDTLFAIAKKYATTVQTLLSANGLGPGSIIYPGQTLRLTPPSTQRFTTLDDAQRANAVRIIRIGRELGVPDRGIAIALATAMVESSMRNLDYGDRDSLGLFQQRPSQGWGTASQILDRDRSIRVFYGGASDPNGANSRGLLDIPGWQSKSFSSAAQAVQISAFPDRYGQWEQQAHQWLATLR